MDNPYKKRRKEEKEEGEKRFSFISFGKLQEIQELEKLALASTYNCKIHDDCITTCSVYGCSGD
jgi:hypothetical protein